MKNFFKKLSFVLAVAMVLTSLTPATASAASKNFVTLKGSKTAVTSVYAWIGGVTRNLDYNINGKTSGVKGTWKSSKEEFVKVDAKTGVITPVANGSAYVTFTTADGKTTVKTVVKARTRAAALHIYDKAEYAAGNKVQLENKEGVTPSAIELKVGETKDLRITMPLSKKQQEAGAKKASYFTYAEVKDDSFVTAEPVADGDERLYTLTAKAPGETTVTIVANQTTQANVRTGKYFREATIDVKVVDAFSVKQTGANKITVTGTDLTDKVEDYVVKKGSTVVNLKGVASLNEAKTEAVLEANVTNLVAGNYTLSFQKGEAFEFAVEAAVVSSIEIISDVAVLHPTNTTQATARYQVKNQFGEDVTANSSLAAPNSKLTISGGTTTSAAPGIVTFESKNEYRPNVDIVALTIVCNTNGVNAQKTLTVSNKAILDTVEFMGIYTTNKSGVLEKVDLKEKTTKTDLEKKYWALFSGKDQYGNTYNEPKSSDGKDQLNVQIAGVPGLTAARENTLSKKKVNNVEYLAVRLSSAYDKLQSGTCTILAIPTMSGKTSSSTIDVTAVAKIDSVSIVTSEVLGGQENSLEYEILDTEGNLVTNYETVRYSGIFYDDNNAPKIAKVKVERKDDGTANIIYTAEPVSGNDSKTDNFSVISETNKVTFVTLTILQNSFPARVTAVKKIAAGENMAIISGHSIDIKASDLTLLDQHGKSFNAWTISDTKPLNIKVSVKADDSTKVITHSGIAVSTGAVTVTSPSVTLVTITGSGVAGTATFTIGDYSCTVNITSTDLTDVGSDVVITVPDMMYQGSTAEITVKTADGAEVPAGKYFILDDYKAPGTNNKIKAPALATGPAVEVVEKTFTITVTVNGKDYKQEVKYSNATPVVASAEKSGAVLSASASAVSGAATGLELTDLQNLITVKNQYKGTDGVSTGDAIRANVTVTKSDGNDATKTYVIDNNTADIKVQNLVKGDKVTIEYTFKGTTYTSKQTFTVGD